MGIGTQAFELGPVQFPGMETSSSSPHSFPLDPRKKLSGPLPQRLEESSAEPGAWDDVGTSWPGDCRQLGGVAQAKVLLPDPSPPSGTLGPPLGSDADSVGGGSESRSLDSPTSSPGKTGLA